MEYMNKSIEELHDLLTSGKVTSEELVKEALELSHESKEDFITIIEDAKSCEVTNNLLSGIPYGISDNISTKDILSTGGSNSLKDYIPFFSATAIEKLDSIGAVKVNKTAIDEFGMGEYNGAINAVKKGIYPYAITSDSSYLRNKDGVVSYKPTYGMISRFGLFPLASSFDHVTVVTRCVKDAAIVADEIKGIDKLDMTSWDSKEIILKDSCGDIKTKKLCYIKELYDSNFDKIIEQAKEKGYIVESVSIDNKMLNAIDSAYKIILSAEAMSNTYNLTGMVFGPRGNGNNYEEQMIDYRTKGFTKEFKSCLITGSYVLLKENQERYFKNAQRTRRLIVDTFKEIFNNYDAIITQIGENQKIVDYLKIANFGGFPSITTSNGINIMSNCYEDEKVINIAYNLEKGGK